MKLPRPNHLKSTVVTANCAVMVSALLCSPCYLQAADSVDGVAFFETHIRPVLVQRCYTCHSEQAGMREGGLWLDRRLGWSEGGDNGPAVIPRDPDASPLLQALRYDGDLQMPPDKRLTVEIVARFEQWIEMGSPDPRDSPRTEALSNASDPIAGRDHWVFRPLTQVAPPSVDSGGSTSESCESPIDAFVSRSVRENGLRPSPDASRRKLIRRLFFVLTGVPPNPRQVQAYLADSRPDAYERLVDELLQSPQFGERWGRHWLDLARYADSNGLDENFLFREAWRYRNWVIAAINEDLPLDRFVHLQIAGDLLPYESIEQRDRQRIAAGFLVMGPKVLLGNDPRKQKMEVADEQLDTIGRTFLGQTLGCARCHDHKFDPIPTADYYALAGIFTSTEVMERRYMLGQQRVMERLVGLGPEGLETDDAYERYWREVAKLKARAEKAKAALDALSKDETEAFATVSKEHPDAIAELARDTSVSLEQRREAQESLVKDLADQIANPPAIPPRAMIPSDADQPADESIRLAGQFDRQGAKVPRGFLRVVSDSTPTISEGESGRLQLAQWLTDVDDGAGRVVARVLANRVWHHAMGRGIVRTVDNFGRTGEEPTHPELLDYLAHRLIETNWCLKQLVREVVLSQTFRQSSEHDAENYAIDPENRWLWRANRRRLDPEALRDAMLATAGQLDLAPMESTVWYLGDQATAVGDNKNRRRTDFPCRSVYLPVIRNDLPELFDVFDFANPHATTGMRSETMVATQGLYLLNDDSVLQVAEHAARRLLSESSGGESSGRETQASEIQDLVDRMYVEITNLPADPQERELMQAFVERMIGQFKEQGVTEAELKAWTLACQALYASSRFQILE